MLKVGKLYSCSGYFLLLYPDKETASAATTTTTALAATGNVHAAAASAAYSTKKLQKPVSYCDPKTPLLVLNTDNHYAEILAGDKKGWIIYQDWLDIKDIVDEAA